MIKPPTYTHAWPFGFRGVAVGGSPRGFSFTAALSRSHCHSFAFIVPTSTPTRFHHDSQFFLRQTKHDKTCAALKPTPSHIPGYLSPIPILGSKSGNNFARTWPVSASLPGGHTRRRPLSRDLPKRHPFYVLCCATQRARHCGTSMFDLASLVVADQPHIAVLRFSHVQTTVRTLVYKHIFGWG
jgi:hypothetical protein